MRATTFFMVGAAAAFTAGAAPAPSAQAQPLSPLGTHSAAMPSDVVKVQRRGYRWEGRRWTGNRHSDGWGRRRGNWVGPAIVGGLVTGAIVGGALSRPGRAYGYAADDGFERCQRTFRSFDPATGTYTTYGGDVVRCPYL